MEVAKLVNHRGGQEVDMNELYKIWDGDSSYECLHWEDEEDSENDED